MAEELVESLFSLISLFKARRQANISNYKIWGKDKPQFVKEWFIRPNYNSMFSLQNRIYEVCECLNLNGPLVLDEAITNEDYVDLILEHIQKQKNNSILPEEELFKCPGLPPIEERIKIHLEKINNQTQT